MATVNESLSDELGNFTALVVDGKTSGLGSELDDAYFDGLRERIEREIADPLRR